jgi:DNA-directed RNA polymerase specialized sigma24 family protein
VEFRLSPKKTIFSPLSTLLSVAKARELAASTHTGAASPVLPTHSLVNLFLTEHFQYVDFPTLPKKEWVLTKEAFDRFLGRLDLDREIAGEKYECIRLKLIKYFEWRGSDLPDMDADETINRVVRRLEEGENIYNLNGYIYGVAKLVYAESLKKRNRKQELIDDASRLEPYTEPDNLEATERQECFDRCMGYLTKEDREIITEYYQYEKGGQKISYRKQLAIRFNISPNALRIRAHRQRVNLEACVEECLGRCA